MRLLYTTILSLPFTFASQIITLSSRADSASSCTDTHIFLAKGNNEPYPGRQGKLVNSICSGLSSCDYEDILFYNPVESGYCDSVIEGAANGIAQIIAYNKRCPGASLVISGYSQGAHIVGDILGGGGGTFFQGCVQGAIGGLDVKSAAGKKISAVLIWGSTRHTASQPYNVFSGADGKGLFPRPESQLAAMAQWTSVLHDYCVSTDPICAGGKDGATHLNYFDLYSDVAAEWAKSQVGSAAEPTTVASSTSASTSSGVASSSSSSLDATSLTVSAIPTPTKSVEVTVSSASVSLTSTADSAASTSASTSPTSTSSSGGAIPTSYGLNLLGLAFAGSIVAHI
ncbi:hypothetical protein ONS95_001400 [Cadophora gregata]|uniref:uncharacterized protein n=1 Tax=Cadophora gregata TaxID=51156 RepID=UPI0026DA90EF|nr:uncharacterized protein ONS95_001400 [Cadophora gregata]KAK0111020.1 hypothetical protein ONS95_001400 [Cadophora gregata]KAK0112522.1 hypothetical protein ONS96_001758 [Cadophora gregata f. sp. sojae]